MRRGKVLSVVVLSSVAMSLVVLGTVATVGVLLVGGWFFMPERNSAESRAKNDPEKVEKEDDYRSRLTKMQYYVTRQKGTERAFTGEYWDNKEPGVYNCVCCGEPLFDADTKFESGTGWPSFWDVHPEGTVDLEDDYSLLGMKRVEVKCKNCDAHLGHVFNDGPNPTGKRYCINSAALDFEHASSIAKDDSPK